MLLARQEWTRTLINADSQVFILFILFKQLFNVDIYNS